VTQSECDRFTRNMQGMSIFPISSPSTRHFDRRIISKYDMIKTSKTANDAGEPRIGDRDCPKLAEAYGLRRTWRIVLHVSSPIGGATGCIAPVVRPASSKRPHKEGFDWFGRARMQSVISDTISIISYPYLFPRTKPGGELVL
jgi:hypothetical protein